MWRSVLIVFCVLCVATVLSEALGLALLWSRGQLTAATVQEIAAVLRGQPITPTEPDPAPEPEQPTTGQIVEQRVLRTLDLGAREHELKLLNSLLTERRAELLAEKSALEKQKRDFDARLAALRADIDSEATERMRSVLLALEPEEAVASLMQLGLEENVRLLSGVPARNLGQILIAFQEAGPDQQKRGGDILKALSRGEPERTVVEDSANAVPPTTRR